MMKAPLSFYLIPIELAHPWDDFLPAAAPIDELQSPTMSEANASPTGRSNQEMSEANASPTGRSNQEMSEANASPTGRSDQEMSEANASPTGLSNQQMSEVLGTIPRKSLNSRSVLYVVFFLSGVT